MERQTVKLDVRFAMIDGENLRGKRTLALTCVLKHVKRKGRQMWSVIHDDSWCWWKAAHADSVIAICASSSSHPQCQPACPD